MWLEEAETSIGILASIGAAISDIICEVLENDRVYGPSTQS